MQFSIGRSDFCALLERRPTLFTFGALFRFFLGRAVVDSGKLTLAHIFNMHVVLNTKVGACGRGLEYEIVKFCEYVQKYYAVKVKYDLSFEDNKTHPFEGCGITSI